MIYMERSSLNIFVRIDNIVNHCSINIYNKILINMIFGRCNNIDVFLEKEIDKFDIFSTPQFGAFDFAPFDFKRSRLAENFK